MAVYINKVNELTQEFHYAHPATKVRINNIFNSYFYGSCLWNLFGNEATRLEKTWNVSQRIMLGLPRQSHRYFIEPLSSTRHIRFALIERFIKFAKSLEVSEKTVLRKIFQSVKRDCRSTTGENLRNLMKLTKKTDVDDIDIGSSNGLVYNPIPLGEEWKVDFAEELVEMKSNRHGGNLRTERVDTVYPRSDIHQRTYYYHSSNHSTVLYTAELFTNILFIDLLSFLLQLDEERTKSECDGSQRVKYFHIYTLFIRAWRQTSNIGTLRELGAVPIMFFGVKNCLKTSKESINGMQPIASS